MKIQVEYPFVKSLKEDLDKGEVPQIIFQNCMWNVVNIIDLKYKDAYGDEVYELEIELAPDEEINFNEI